jgi:hypothetical protein
MKSIKIIFIILACSTILASCAKKTSYTFPTNGDLSQGSLIQVYSAIVTSSTAYRSHIFVDGTLLTFQGSSTIAASAIAPGGVFPQATIANASYIPSGLKSFLVRDTAASSTLPVFSFAENMTPGRNYTIFLYDTVTTIKQKTVQTDIVIPTDSTARLRFANFVYSTTAVPAVDIFSKRQNVNVFTNVAVTDVTNFIPYPSAVNDTFFVTQTPTKNHLTA